MGNKNNRLTVFENIIDHIDTNEQKDNIIPIKQAILERNTPYLFIALSLYDVNVTTPYGMVKLTYLELLKKYKHLFTQTYLDIIKSDSRVMNKDWLPLVKDNYVSSYYNVKEQRDNNNNDIAYEAIITGDHDTMVTLVKCFGFNIATQSSVEEHYTMNELLTLHEDDHYWQIIGKLMHKNYNYDRLKVFLRDTLEKKREVFNLYKLFYLYGVNHDISKNIISNTCDVNSMDDIYTVVMFNKLLRLDEFHGLDKVFECVYTLEKYKMFWLWLKDKQCIDDIINYIFGILFPKNIQYDNIRLPLLLL